MDQGNNNQLALHNDDNLETEMPNDDQCFLLFFIMGTYFGPDIKGEETTKKSVLQRVAEGLPPYTLGQLASSFMKVVELEHVYYYVLRNADKSLTLNLPFLHQTFQGLDDAENCNYPRFPDLFPPELHPLSWFKIRHKIVHNIVFINNPEVSYLKPEDVERFKRLSGVRDFYVDREAARLHNSLDGGVLCNVPVGKVEPDENTQFPAFQSCSSTGSQKPECDDSSNLQDDSFKQQAHAVAPIRSVPCDDTNVMCGYTVPEDENDPDKVGPAMLFLPSRPTENEWSDIVAATKNGFGLTGSAAMGQVGPMVGLVDIGECEDAYLFRMSLPGVKRDEKEFSCEVDTDGKVAISGVTTTGEETVSRYSQVFEMQTHNLCPPGDFSVTFQLPGPVDPHQFSGNFGTDGILEGIVMKRKLT